MKWERSYTGRYSEQEEESKEESDSQGQPPITNLATSWNILTDDVAAPLETQETVQREDRQLSLESAPIP